MYTHTRKGHMAQEARPGHTPPMGAGSDCDGMGGAMCRQNLEAQ